MQLTQRHNAKRNGSGFTLVELIVVMFLLAGVLALAAPNLSRFFQSRYVTEEARRFQAVTLHAQRQAIASGFPVTIWIEPEASRYGFIVQNPFQQRGVQDSMETLDPRALYSLKSEIMMAVNPNEIDQATARYLIRFLPDGSIDPGSTQTIQFVRSVNPTEDFIWVTRSPTKDIYEIQRTTPIYNASSQPIR